MQIHHVEETTLQDFPGRIACAVFLHGCNFRCSFCHNPRTVRDKADLMPPARFFEFLASRQDKLDGVVVSGGEPTIQKGLPSFLANIKRMGFAVKLDTNGSNPDMLKAILKEGLADYVAMDVKAPLDRYAKVVGVAGMTKKIRRSIALIKKSGVPHEFRTTVWPGMTSEDLIVMHGLIKGSPYFLQQYRDDVTLHPQKHLSGYSKETLRRMACAVDAEVR